MSTSIRVTPDELRALSEQVSDMSEAVIQGYSDMLEHLDYLSQVLEGDDYRNKIECFRDLLNQGLSMFKGAASGVYNMERRIAMQTMEPIYGTPDMMTGNFKFES